MTAGRKVFHCAVDDTVLTTSLGEIKKWLSHGAITIFVPLYTLERLRILKKGGNQIAANARDAVRFLDRVTSGKDSIPPDRVMLQGPMEQYESWTEAEKYFLPEFEEEMEAEPDAIDDTEDGISTHPISPDFQSEKMYSSHERIPSNDLSQMLLSKLNFKREPDSLSTVSNGTHSGPASRSSSRSSRTYHDRMNGDVMTSCQSDGAGHQRSASSSSIPSVPPKLRPLLSALLWRLHSSPESSAVTKSCVLVTNDRNAQNWGQKFGVLTKNVQQLRTAIQYEDKEYKNHCKYVEKTQTVEQKPLFSYDNDSDQDELVFVPRGRGSGKAVSRGGNGRGGNARKAGNPRNLSAPVDAAIDVPSEPIDPDSFNRSLPGIAKPAIDLSTQNGTARSHAAASSRRHGGGRRGDSSRGGSLRGSGRGRGKLWVP